MLKSGSSSQPGGRVWSSEEPPEVKLLLEEVLLGAESLGLES